MNLYETAVYGKPRQILRLLAEQGPQSSLNVIARAIGDSTAETSVHWRALEQKGLVHRATGNGISYSLACRLIIREMALTKRYRGRQPDTKEHVGDCLSQVMDFLEEFHGLEFQCLDIAEGAGLTVSASSLHETLVRMNRNGLINVRRGGAKAVFYSSADNSGLADVEAYLRDRNDKWHATGKIITGTGRPSENVRMLLRVLQYRGVILRENMYGHQCWWKWGRNDE